MFTKKITDLTKQDRCLAGGKGAFLGEMVLKGIPVPPGFVILTAAFEEFFERSGLSAPADQILHDAAGLDLAGLETAAQAFQDLIISAEFPEPLAQEIAGQFQELHAELVAVRSSATAEDAACNAWAGQLETYLNTDESSLLENVKRCWASLYSPRALCYRMNSQQLDEKIAVAVVVQKMVASAVAGVAFSVHPVTEDVNTIVIEAGIGLGEAVVSGAITPDNYVIEKEPARIVQKFISTQAQALCRLSDGQTGWQTVPRQHKHCQKLTDAQIMELSRLVLEIEKSCGFPCDVEWGLHHNTFCILQCRPITTLSE